MAFLGRESAADQRRAERVKAWVQARSPYALFSLGFGVVAVFDFFTGLGVPLGIIAVVVGWLGLRDLARRPELIGRRVAISGITLGVVGIALTVAWFVLLPLLTGLIPEGSPDRTIYDDAAVEREVTDGSQTQ